MKVLEEYQKKVRDYESGIDYEATAWKMLTWKSNYPDGREAVESVIDALGFISSQIAALYNKEE